MVPQQVREFLDRERVAYQVVAHEKAFTAQGVAATLHVSGWTFAKTVILKTRDGRLVMAVLAGPHNVNLKAARAVVGSEVDLAPEAEFAPKFPGCELGAEPPLGNLYGLPVYIDACFPPAQDFFFQAGNHHEVVRMRYQEYERLVKPVVGEFCLHEREKSRSQ